MRVDKLGPLCKEVFDFMHGLDSEGLNWDEEEALKVLEPLAKLELNASVDYAREHADTNEDYP